MAQRAMKDTFGYETVGPGIEVRRQVKAGNPVPEHYRLEDPSVVADTTSPTVTPVGRRRQPQHAAVETTAGEVETSAKGRPKA